MLRLALVLAALASCQREEPAGSGDCSIVATRIHQAVESQIDAVGSDAKILIAKMMPAMQVACVEDHWPAPRNVVATFDIHTDANPDDRCEDGLQDPVQRS